MRRYILKRVLLMIPVLLGVTLLIFTLLYFSDGDPARNMLGTEATEKQVEELREEMGLNDPFVIRYVRYLKQLTVDHTLGTSYMTKQDISGEIVERFKVTFVVAVESTVIALIIGTLFGVIAAVKQNTWIDNISMTAALIGASMPAFWLAILLSVIFALHLHVLPASGWGTFKDTILPCVSLAIGAAGGLARQARSSMLEVIRQDYIVTAKAKGVSNLKVIFVHALRNALIPVITSAGNTLGWLVGGVVITEQIFSIPGLGMYMVSAINQRDYPVVQGGVLFIALMFSLVMLLVDILYAFIDPRIKASYKTARKAKKRKAYL